jgi:hypothetical protein
MEIFVNEVKRSLSDNLISYSINPNFPNRLYINKNNIIIYIEGSYWNPEYYINETRCTKTRIIPIIELILSEDEDNQ